MKVPAYVQSGGMLGTTGDKWGTAVTEPIDDNKTLQGILKGEMPIYIYGVVQYLDVFGEYHETGFCSLRLPQNGPFINCEYGNWFDKRPQNNRQRPN